MQPESRYSKPGITLGVLHRLPPLRIWFLLGLCLMSLLVSGCVRSDLAVHYNGQAGGEIVQQIQLAESLAGGNESSTQPWFDQIERQARQLRGRVQHRDQGQLTVTIPFGTAAELEQKLNQFLQPPSALTPTERRSPTPPPLLPPLPAQVKVQEQNFLLFVRNHLSFDLDLRSLGVQSSEGELLLSPDPLLDLHFSLQTPWGARNLQPRQLAAGLTLPPATRQDQNLTWTLQPGQQNHLEAVFWYPSPVALGAIAIAGIIWLGFFLKYGRSGTHDLGETTSEL